MNRKFLTSALLFAAFTTSAMAEEQVWRVGDGFSIVTTDLNLADAADRSRLLRRVEFASREVCRDVSPRRSREDCAEQTLARTVESAAPSLRQALAAARFETQTRRLARR